MKKQLFSIASVAMIAGVVTFSSCAQEDVTAPVITVTGGNSQTQSLPATAGAGSWTNPVATANDDEDGEITSISVTGTVDPNTAGAYTLTYTCSDAAGNTASEVVTVNIVNEAQFLDGDYNGDDTCTVFYVEPYPGVGNPPPAVIASTTVNNQFQFRNFGGFGQTVFINASLGTGNAINIPFGQALDAPGNTITNATGSYTITPSTKINVTYIWSTGSSSETCTMTWDKQ
jgi:hypothetical protein